MLQKLAKCESCPVLCLPNMSTIRTTDVIHYVEPAACILLTVTSQQDTLFI